MAKKKTPQKRSPKRAAKPVSSVVTVAPADRDVARAFVERLPADFASRTPRARGRAVQTLCRVLGIVEHVARYLAGEPSPLTALSPRLRAETKSRISA